MLIIHGTRDPLVPVAAALEHHRLVPQSELKILDDNHFMVFQRPEVVLQPVQDFLERIMKTTHLVD
jgi:pimeloyl-ACP methyl ester carboxylesterase